MLEAYIEVPNADSKAMISGHDVFLLSSIGNNWFFLHTASPLRVTF